MPLSDSTKYYDSLISIKRGIIAAQDTTIQGKQILLDSLDKSIAVKHNVLKIERSFSEICSSFFHNLKRLMISEEIAVFVAGCIIMGLVIISADWLTFLAGKGERRKSMFSLKYTNLNKIIFNYLLWGMGSGVLAYITIALGMFKCTFMSCAVIAVTWPGLLPRIIKNLNKEEEDEIQQPN